MPTTLPRPNRTTFLSFALLGFVISLTILLLLMNWMPLLAALYGKPNLGWYDVPPILHVVQWTLGLAVCLMPLAVFALDYRKREYARAIGYSMGFVLAGIAAFVVILVSYSSSMATF